MAFRDKFKSAPEDADRKEEKGYANVGWTEADRKKSTEKARKRGRRLLIGLGIAAAITTVMFPFAIGLAVTAAGATGVALGGTAVLLGGAAIGCDVGLVGAWAATRASRRKGRTARDIANKNIKGLRHVERSETKDLISAMAKEADPAEVKKQEKLLDADHTKDLVTFEGVDADIIDAWRSQPLSADEEKLLKAASKKSGVDLVDKFNKKQAFTDDEKAEVDRVRTTFAAFKDIDFGDMGRRIDINAKKLTNDELALVAKGMRPDDSAVMERFGDKTIITTKPLVYEEYSIKVAGATDAEIVDMGGYKVRTQQGHEIYKMQQGVLAKQIGAEIGLNLYTPDTTIKHRHQRKVLDETAAKESKKTVAVIEAGANAFTK